jgi:hypothetical protein
MIGFHHSFELNSANFKLAFLNHHMRVLIQPNSFMDSLVHSKVRLGTIYGLLSKTIVLPH